MSDIISNISPSSGASGTTLHTLTINAHTGRSLRTQNILAKINSVTKKTLSVTQDGADIFIEGAASSTQIAANAIQAIIIGRCNAAGLFFGPSETAQSVPYIDNTAIDSNSPFKNCTIVFVPRSNEIGSLTPSAIVASFPSTLGVTSISGVPNINSAYALEGKKTLAALDYGEKDAWNFSLLIKNIPANTSIDPRSFTLKLRNYDGSLISTITITQLGADEAVKFENTSGTEIQSLGINATDTSSQFKVESNASYTLEVE